MSLLQEAPPGIVLLNKAATVEIPIPWDQDFTSIPEGLGLDLKAERLDAIAFQKRRDWEARKSLLPMEVLTAIGITNQEEFDFFLGKTDKDPNPSFTIKFPKLVRGQDIITEDELELIHASLPERRRISRERGTFRQEFAVALSFEPLPLMSTQQHRTMIRLSNFSSAILEATATASLDLGTSERRALEGKNDNGFPAVDPHPTRKPTYHRLVAIPYEDFSAFEA